MERSFMVKFFSMVSNLVYTGIRDPLSNGSFQIACRIEQLQSKGIGRLQPEYDADFHGPYIF